MTAQEKKITLTGTELKELMTEAVTETLTGLGFDVQHPLKVQRDLMYLRGWCDTMASIRGKAILATVGVAVVGICGVIWLGFKSIICR